MPWSRIVPPKSATERLSAQLVLDHPREHDLDNWAVTDDWPEFVPVTSDEVEVVEAFLRNALDDFLK